MSTTIELPSNRLISVDAYRGTVMFLMLAEILRLGAVSRGLPDSEFWKLISTKKNQEGDSDIYDFLGLSKDKIVKEL